MDFPNKIWGVSCKFSLFNQSSEPNRAGMWEGHELQGEPPGTIAKLTLKKRGEF